MVVDPPQSPACRFCDIMYFNTDGPGQKVQDSGKLLKRAAVAPDHPLYKRPGSSRFRPLCGRAWTGPAGPARTANSSRSGITCSATFRL